MAKEKLTEHSISKVLQEETLVTDTAINEYQEDMRLAEKERLQSNQKRSQLLETLRHSFKKSDRPSCEREGLQQEFIRIVREGSSQEIERTIKQYQKQLDGLKSNDTVSHQTDTAICHFFDRTKVFVEKKRILEKVEKTIAALSVTDGDGRTKTNAVSTLTQLTDISAKLQSDLLSLTDTILAQIESIEDRIEKDLYQEEKKRTLFFTCLSTLDEQKKGKLISLCQKKTQGTAYDKRLYFYRTIIEQLAKIDENVARKIHAITRKEARSLLKQGQYKQASSELCYALHLWKDDVLTYRLLADVFFLLKDEKNAYVALGEALRLCPEDDSLRHRMAEYWVRKNSLQKAVREYQILADRSPNNQSYRRELGRLLFETKSYDRVPDVLLDYVRTMPEDRECINYIGHAYVHLRNLEKAVHCFRQSIGLNPAQPDIYQVLSVAYRNLELYDNAIELLMEGIRSNPESLALKIQLGNIYLDNEMWDRVIGIFQPVLDAYPNSPALLVSLGQAELALGNAELAITYLSQANECKSDDFQTLAALARAYRKKGDHPNVERTYEKAIRANPGDSGLQQELASFYVEGGEWQKATEILRQINNN